MFEIPPQQILSTDSVTLTVDAVIYYRVFDPVRAACRVLDFNQVTYNLLPVLIIFSHFSLECQKSSSFNIRLSARHLHPLTASCGKVESFFILNLKNLYNIDG